jgi:hypothetical protein
MLAVQGSDYGVIQAISNSGSTTLEMMGSSGIGYVGTRTNHPVAFRTNDTERMRIDSSGNVGIGTSSPSSYDSSSKLAVVSASNTSITVGSGSTGLGQILFANGTSGASVYNGLIRYDHNGNAMSFFTNGGNQRMIIDSSGNLLVGGTSTLNANARLSVWNTAGAATGIATGYGTTNGQFRLIYLLSTNNSLNFDSGTNNATLSSAGAWTNASDVRLKKNIVDIKYGLADVLKTQPRSYEMNDVEGEYIGFIAQELQKVIPEVVSGDPEKQLGVDYGSLVSLAFKAIQEQQAIITDLKARIETLESK